MLDANDERANKLLWHFNWPCWKIWNSPRSIDVAWILYLFQSDLPRHDVLNKSPHWFKNKKVISCSNYKSINERFNLFELYQLFTVKVCPTISDVAGGGEAAGPFLTLWFVMVATRSAGRILWLQPSANSLAAVDDEWLTRSTHFEQKQKCRVWEIWELLFLFFLEVWSWPFGLNVMKLLCSK